MSPGSLSPPVRDALHDDQPGVPPVVFIRERLEKAREGNIDAAWTLIDDLIQALDQGVVVRELYEFAAGFFEELRRIRASKAGARKGKSPTQKELSKTLCKLYIVRGQGRTQRDVRWKLAVLVAFQRLTKNRKVSKLEAIEVLVRLRIVPKATAMRDLLRSLGEEASELPSIVERLVDYESRMLLADRFNLTDAQLESEFAFEGPNEELKSEFALPAIPGPAMARGGDVEAAWALIDNLIQALHRGDVVPKLYEFAADFFEELRQIRDSKGSSPSQKELSEALRKLCIVRGQGRPPSSPSSVKK
jgi:hypothetical protein